MRMAPFIIRRLKTCWMSYMFSIAFGERLLQRFPSICVCPFVCMVCIYLDLETTNARFAISYCVSLFNMLMAILPPGPLQHENYIDGAKYLVHSRIPCWPLAHHVRMIIPLGMRMQCYTLSEGHIPIIRVRFMVFQTYTLYINFHKAQNLEYNVTTR